MNINATLFVQIINFLIVYVLLRFFLFKPIITIIEHEEKQENILTDLIAQQKKSLEIQEKERQQHWNSCQEYFLSLHPYIASYLTQIRSFFSQEIEYDNKTNQTSMYTTIDIATNISNTLEEKIKHVH